MERSFSWSVVVLLVPVCGAGCERAPALGTGEDVEPDNDVEGNAGREGRDDERTGPPCFLGDPSAPAQGELVWRTPDGRTEALVDGQELPLLLPPQGGKVVLLGARVRNMGCALTLTAGVFDDCQDSYLAIDGRPLHLDWNPQTGWAEPRAPETLNNFGNIAMCFNHNSARDTNDEEYRFDVRITDEDDKDRVLALSGRATPVCAQADLALECDCECDVDFSFERSCDEIREDPDVPRGTCLGGNDDDD
jgi:hypothetical protein